MVDSPRPEDTPEGEAPADGDAAETVEEQVKVGFFASQGAHL